MTLTNMSEKDVDRIIKYHLSPINISFQTTNPELRCRMLHNRFAGESLKKVDRFYEAGIQMNGQIVLCRGFNDGEELERSIRDLTKYLPHLQSVSVVPVGLSRFREGLEPLEPFTREDARRVLEQIHRWQEKLYPEYGLHFVHASDEWDILAGEELPREESYDGYLQLENGVGMIRLMLEEFEDALARLEEPEALENRILKGHLFLRNGPDCLSLYPPDGGSADGAVPGGENTGIPPLRNDFFRGTDYVTGLLTDRIS